MLSCSEASWMEKPATPLKEVCSAASAAVDQPVVAFVGERSEGAGNILDWMPLPSFIASSSSFGSGRSASQLMLQAQQFSSSIGTQTLAAERVRTERRDQRGTTGRSTA